MVCHKIACCFVQLTHVANLTFYIFGKLVSKLCELTFGTQFGETEHFPGNATIFSIIYMRNR